MVFSEMMDVYRVPLDYITLLMCTWNFSVVGVIAIFWNSPLWLQQAYLIAVSTATVSNALLLLVYILTIIFCIVYQYVENATMDYMDSFNSCVDIW